jgi:hypothetical protein
MITTFDTSVAPPTGGNSSEGSGSNAVLWFIGLAVVGYVAYKFVIEPEMNKDKIKKQNG